MNEDEELEMKEEVPDLKTSLENADPKKQNKGRRRRRSTGWGREKEEEKKNRCCESKWWNLSLKNSSSTWIFFPHELPSFVTRVLKTRVLSWNSSFKHLRC